MDNLGIIPEKISIKTCFDRFLDSSHCSYEWSQRMI